MKASAYVQKYLNTRYQSPSSVSVLAIVVTDPIDNERAVKDQVYIRFQSIYQGSEVLVSGFSRAKISSRSL